MTDQSMLSLKGMSHWEAVLKNTVVCPQIVIRDSISEYKLGKAEKRKDTQNK